MPRPEPGRQFALSGGCLTSVGRLSRIFMKKYTLTIIAMLLLFPALHSAGVRGLLSWLNTPAVTKAEVPGKDGSLTVTTANTIVNRYSFLVVDAPAGSTT